MIYKLKNAGKRATFFAAAVALFAGIAASALPSLVSADALNPLTERSLTLSSSSPGYHYLDGSGNPTYAPPGSGNNGQKTGETFTFKVSSDSSGGGAATVKGFTFQYCTSPAGHCTAPGDDHAAAVDGVDDASHTDLEAHYSASPTEGTNYSVETSTNNGTSWTTNTGWTISTDTLEDSVVTADNTGKQNYIKLVNSTGGLTIAPGTEVRVTFKATSTNYITNPGEGAFFVKLNDYTSATTLDNTTLQDGGVTVANVMNDSIQIQTKVLETMSFSVGTTNPDTVAAPSNDHGTCDNITANDPLEMGKASAENSLEVNKAYDTYSYWRLSSNSSGGATVYYSGNPLSNTEGDQIQAIGTTAKISHPGTEQFGLALDSTADTLDSYMTTAINTDAAASPPPQFPHLAPHLTPLIAKDGTGGAGGPTDYSHGAGGINSGDAGGITALFAFDHNSLSVAVPIANEATDVVTCATGKMRYLANIAATTPAGVYTSRINYIAAPEY